MVSTGPPATATLLSQRPSKKAIQGHRARKRIAGAAGARYHLAFPAMIGRSTSCEGLPER